MTGRQGKGAEFYRDNGQHLADELSWLDQLIRLRAALFRADIEAGRNAGECPSVYISHGEVERLLGRGDVDHADTAELRDIRMQLAQLRSDIDARVERTSEQGVYLALPQLARLFALSPFEREAVVICLAPELRRKYDRLYAYLQDDITRKRPSVDLVLDLLCDREGDKWDARAVFSEHGTLMRAGLLRKTDDPQSPSGSSGLAQFLELDPRVLDFLLGRNRLDARLIDLADWHRPSEPEPVVDGDMAARLLRLAQAHFAAHRTARKSLVISLSAPCASGPRDLAVKLCGDLGCSLICLDLELLLAHPLGPESLLRAAFRECLLMGAALFFDRADALLKEDAARAGRLLARLAAEYGWLVFLGGVRHWKPTGPVDQLAYHALTVPVPNESLRQALWEKALQRQFQETSLWAAQLALRFRLTAAQIADALEFAEHEAAMRDGGDGATLADLHRGCRLASKQDLGELAVGIEPRYGWQDLVLPAEQLTQLKEICGQVTHHYRVFGEWGFERKLAHGKGLSVLFSGPPGTGKTMAAQVIAGELQLDLYRIDLSGVVSKYIGETEKNLAKIFRNAEAGNAILFFDEADALFGKRTEVSDAHDRYANIETSYLLQKMEEYEGVVILATNLRSNMDDAFLRRIRFIVEFPFPDEASRLQIWRSHFPKETPLSDSIDYEYLSRELAVAGGNIKNIVLNSAFLAAENGGVISMEHILCGARREYEKIGKLWSDGTAHRQKRLNG